MTGYRDTEAQRTKNTKRFSVSLCLCGLAVAAIAIQAQTRPPTKPLPQGSYAQNVEYIGFTNGNGDPPFKSGWYMSAGAQTDRGWSILDVTDPATPKVLNWIPGPKNTRSGELDIADGKLITAAERSQMGGDTDPNAPWDDGIVIWSLKAAVHA